MLSPLAPPMLMLEKMWMYQLFGAHLIKICVLPIQHSVVQLPKENKPEKKRLVRIRKYRRSFF
jgi:hypothetical protein